MCNFTHSPNRTFYKQYFLQNILARFYFLVKIPVVKFRINFTGYTGFHILLMLSDHMLFILEKILSTWADVGYQM